MRLHVVAILVLRVLWPHLVYCLGMDGVWGCHPTLSRWHLKELRVWGGHATALIEGMARRSQCVSRYVSTDVDLYLWMDMRGVRHASLRVLRRIWLWRDGPPEGHKLHALCKLLNLRVCSGYLGLLRRLLLLIIIASDHLI